MKLLLRLLAAIASLAAATTHAHHSFAAIYDANQVVTIEGRLVSFSFRSPHSVVTVETEDEAGAKERWTVEWGAASALSNQGVTRSFFKPGDEVIITGFPGRNPAAHVMVMRSLVRPADGFEWGNREGETVD